MKKINKLENSNKLIVKENQEMKENLGKKHLTEVN
jgi:hypothetical protein